MALLYPYADAYLAPLITQAREDQAVEAVTMLGTFPADWTQRLTVYQSYIIACTECMKSVDDVFSAKLTAYRKMLADALPAARAAQAAADEDAGVAPIGGGSIFTVDLQRG